MYKKILKLAGPIIFANILQIVYQLTDLFWIGRYSKDGVAAISLSGPVIMFFVSLGIGLTLAGTILIAQYRGKKDYKGLNVITGQSIFLTTIFSLVISLLGYFFSGFIVRLMGADPSVVLLAIDYLKISFIGLIGVIGYMTVQSLWRGMGEVKIPVFIVLGTVLLNFVLDPLLILGYGNFSGLGVNGAAFATMITQGIAWIMALYLLFRTSKYHLHFSWKHFAIHSNFTRKFFRLAIPSGIEMSARSLGMVVLAYIVATFSTDVIAAYGVGNQIFSIIIFVGLGFSMAATTLSGQFYGAKKFDKIIETKEKSLKLSIFILLLIGICIFFYAKTLVSVFVPGEIEVITLGTNFLHVFSLFLRTVAIQMIYAGMFRGLGEAKIPMYLTIISLRCLQIPVAYFGSKFYGEWAIWASIPIAYVISAVVTQIWYHYWKKNFLEKNRKGEGKK